MKDAALYVLHEGSWKLIGKAFNCPLSVAPDVPHWIIRHEESGTQNHRNSDAPGGVDVVAVLWAIQRGIVAWHHKNRTTKALYTVAPKSLLFKGKRQSAGGRDRLYLPYADWRKERDTYTVPWIQAETRIDYESLDLDAVRAEVGEIVWSAFTSKAVARKKAVSALEQGELF